jgi:hypothetical protein
MYNFIGGCMKTRLLLFSFFALLFFSVKSSAQISNLKVNNVTSNFSMTSGDTVSWSYTVSPNGATTTVGIWYYNEYPPYGYILWQSFTQTDGDTMGNNGPPDMDGTVNGAVFFKQTVGLAPGMYEMIFTEGGASDTVKGTVNHLSSPAHTISGTITVPQGKSALDIFVEAEPSGSGGKDKGFWDGVTDLNGNYTIEMNADTTGNPWRLRVVNNLYAPAIVTPREQDVDVAAATITGINFSIVAAAAQVDGTVKDENGNAVVGQDVELWRNDNNNGSNVQYSGRTDVNGLFLIGAQSSDLLAGKTWTLQVYEQNNNGQTGSFLDAIAQIPSLAAGDSIFRNLVVYSANSSIQGTVEINGNPPGFPMQLYAQVQDTAQAAAWCDGGTGNFSIPVSNKLYNYQITENFQTTTQYNFPNITAHPGQTGVVINITSTGVAEGKNIQPLEFSLRQNYPNPFNPSTSIQYSVAGNQNVTLKVFDVLGREIATLVNEQKAPGTYRVQFDGNKLGSGMYFYTLRAGSFTETKQMMLVK